MHSWNTFGAQTSHGHTQIHKTHHVLDFGEANTFPLIIFSMINHKGCVQMSFFSRFPKIPKLGILKFPKLGLPKLWRPITSCIDLRLKLGPKQSCSSHWELSNDMWCITYTHVIQSDSQHSKCECDSQVAFSARIYTCLYLGCKPKVRVMTPNVNVSSPNWPSCWAI